MHPDLNPLYLGHLLQVGTNETSSDSCQMKPGDKVTSMTPSPPWSSRGHLPGWKQQSATVSLLPSPAGSRKSGTYLRDKDPVSSTCPPPAPGQARPRLAANEPISQQYELTKPPSCPDMVPGTVGPAVGKSEGASAASEVTV